MRFIKLFSAAVFLFVISFSAPASAATDCTDESSASPANHIPAYTEAEIRSRLSQMTNGVIPPRFTSVVKGYIDTYTLKRRDRTEAMLGRTQIYFPMFEHYLAKHGLPQDLKYLSVVESALEPNALSRSGAAGLWQFMPPTGKSMGLRINSTVDDRKDPHKSTEAALKYLAKQYKRFGSWELALAAYNGGPGRVNRAIKRGRSKNFWRITKYLPRETRNYVPAFIGASYVTHYYDLHALNPVYPERNLTHTALTKIYDQISFIRLAEITGTPYDVIVTLNPSYKRSYIPANRNGNNLVLPREAMANYLNGIGRPDHKLNQMIAASAVDAPASRSMETKDHAVSSHKVLQFEDLYSIAQQYNCKVGDIVKWNKLNSENVNPDQHLMLFLHKRPSELIAYQPLVGLPFVKIYPESEESTADELEMPARAIPQIKISGKYSNIRSKEYGKYAYHKMKRRETLMDVAEKYPEVTLDQIMKLNGINEFSNIRPGKKIKIRKK